MKKIQFYPSTFLAEESNSMAKQIGIAIQSSKSTDVTLLKAKTAIEFSNERLTRVINAMLTNPYTIKLNIADAWRDGVYIGGRNSVEAFTHWEFEMQKKEAADRLIEVFIRNGWSLQNYNYSKQSSATNSLIAELKKPEHQADLATLGLMNWYTELIKSQDSFENVFNQKAGAQNSKESVEKRDAQIPVNQEIEKLVTYLNSIIMFNEDSAEWNSIYNEIEGIVKQFTVIAKTRRSNQKPNGTDNTDKPESKK